MLADNDIASNDASVEDVMKRIFQNPGTMANLFKKASDKIDQKVRSGELNNSDIIRDTTSLLAQMKDIPGMDKIGELFGKPSTSSPVNNGIHRTKSDMIKDRLRKKAKK